LKDSGRAQYVAVTDSQALEGFKTLCRTEGIIPALEPSHALYHAMQVRSCDSCLMSIMMSIIMVCHLLRDAGAFL
ncbi:hypothetical protein T492DRAFT_586718, partial [Pavlovales sp. CCMP2436]